MIAEAVLWLAQAGAAVQEDGERPPAATTGVEAAAVGEPPRAPRFAGRVHAPPAVAVADTPVPEVEPLVAFRGEPVRAIEQRFPDGSLLSRRYVRTAPGGATTDHGPEWRWHANGVLASARTWVAGKQDGLVMEWNETGFVQSQRSYVDDRIDGVSFEFDPRGRVLGVHEWKLGLRHGGSWTWHVIPRKPRFESRWSEGLQVGVSHQWGTSEQCEIESHWESGVQHGPHVVWHKNGVMQARGAYAEGELSGLWERWTPEGQKVLEERYEKGVLEGLQVRWGPDGEKLNEARYAAGEADGVWREWWPSGGLKSEVAYRAGTAHGLSVYWYEDGTKQIEGERVLGRREGRWTYWNPDGSVDESSSGIYAGDRKVE